ncbi:hypothetical protein BYT27DRAFT_7263741 [Phlegmacium glaucopus]|nr:hypothetical protein BYT27DRAFT_7263741 [Phlegmacium glaucopus]
MPNLDDLMDHSFSSPPPEDFEPFSPRPRGHESDNLWSGGVPPGNATFLSPSSQNTPSLPSSNIMTFARQYSMQRRLKQAQLQEVMDFIQHPLDERFVMLYVAIIQSRDQQEQRARELAAWVPSSTTETYARYVLFSPKIKAYKSNVAESCVWTIICNLRWDIPEGVFSNPAATAKLDERIRYHLTQHRSSIKKKVANSVAGADKSDRQHIFALAQAVVANTSVSISIQLCAQLALLRAVYIENKGKEFFAKVDARLVKLRIKYGAEPAKLARFFRKLLLDDIAAYGHNDLDIEILAQGTQPMSRTNTDW